MSLPLGRLLILAALAAAPAAAKPLCDAETHKQFGETRASFQDVWAGCDPQRACHIVAYLIDEAMPLKFSHELRLSQAPDAQLLGVALTAVADDVAIEKTMRFVYGTTSVDLTGAVERRDNVVNVFHVKDPSAADALARGAIAASKTARWVYKDTYGETKTIKLPMRGASKALSWIACMAKRPS